MKKKMLLTGILSFATAFTGAIALVGCSTDEGTNKEDLKQVYAQYVAYTQAEGLTPLPYGEWLEEGGEFDGGELEGGGLDGDLEEETHTHVWSEVYSFNDGEHWLTCDSCDERDGLGAHTKIVNGVCTVCDGLVAPTDGVKYEASWDGTYAKVVGYEGTSARVRFAENYNGLPVLAVDSYAFDNRLSITELVIPNSVLSIGNYAFRNCDNLQSVRLGDGVSEMATYAFLSCDRLTDFTVTENNTAYTSIDGNLYDKSGNKLLQYAIGKTETEFVALDGVTEIGTGAFAYANNLARVELGSGVEKIGESAFRNCDGLMEAQIGESALLLGDYAFYDCDKLTEIVIANGLESIGKGAFSGCDRLAYAQIPDSVTYLGESAFANCDALYGVLIGDGVTVIEDKTFRNCDGLTLALMGESVTYIGEEAFQNCYGLVVLATNEKLCEIGKNAFNGCYNLLSIELPESLTAIADGAFEGCYKLVEVVNNSNTVELEKGSTEYGGVARYALDVYNVAGYESKLSLDGDGYVLYKDGEEIELIAYLGEAKELILPAYITKIYGYAFYCNTRLTDVVIPETVKSIGERAFYNCSRLTGVVIQNGVEEIGDGAFQYCTALTKIVIPKSVTSMGVAVFGWCNSITVYCKAVETDVLDTWSEYWLYCNRPVVWGYVEPELRNKR